MDEEEKVGRSKSDKVGLRDNDMNDYDNSEISQNEVEYLDKDHMESQSKISNSSIRLSFHNSDIDIYLLANPFSGSREAKAYTSLPLENYRFTLDGDNEVFLRVVNITEPGKLDESKEYIKNSIDCKFNRDLSDDTPVHMSKYGKKIIVVICGGDGTFMNIVQEFKRDGIDVDHLIWTQFPFGTANDVANAFGWGRKPGKKMLNNLFQV